jgi:hypothetical protein
MSKRDYAHEYAIETRQRKDARAQRNRARRVMVNEGKAKTGDGKDVGHKKAISKGGKNTLANLEMQTPSENRSFDRWHNRKMKSEISTREKKGKK